MRVRDFDFLLFGTAMAQLPESGLSANPVARGKGGLLTQPAGSGKRQTAGFSARPQTKMAGPKAGQGMQEGRRTFALASSLIGSGPTPIVNKKLSLNDGERGRCEMFSKPGQTRAFGDAALCQRTASPAYSAVSEGRVKIASRLRKFIPFFK
jgi:hypothetical protein